MKLICLMPVRNEEWVLGLSARAALMWCDQLVIGLHRCMDDSFQIARFVQDQHAGRVTIIQHREENWTEMAHRQRLLEVARERGATHIAMIDADEVLTGNLLMDNGPVCIERLVTELKPSTVLQLPWLALPRTTDRYLTSGIWGPGQQVSMAFKDEPGAHWALHDGGRDFHHRNPMGIGRNFHAPLKPEQGGIMHLQFLSHRRLRAKQALYKAVEVLRWPAPTMLNGKKCNTDYELKAELNAMYGRAVYDSDPAKHTTAPAPLEWWLPYAHLMSYLDVSETEAPWQEIALRRLIAEHGAKTFAGLDFFGVV
jgi:hypothetical protein